MKTIFARLFASFGAFRERHAARRDVWESGAPVRAALAAICAPGNPDRAARIAALDMAIEYAHVWRNLPGAAELSGAAGVALESILYGESAHV